MTLNRIELDAQTGQATIIELKGDELTAYNEYVATNEAEVAARTDVQTKAEADKAAAQAKLAALGLTAYDLKALGL